MGKAIYFQEKVWVGFLSALLLTISLAVYSFVSNARLKETARRVAYTNEVAYEAAQLLSLFIDVKCEKHAYSATGNNVFLKSYSDPVEVIWYYMLTLNQLTGDQIGPQQQIIALLKLAIRPSFAKSAVDTRLIGLEYTQGLKAAMGGKMLSGSRKKMISSVEEDEQPMQKETTDRQQSDVQRFNYMLTALLVLTVIIVVLTFNAIRINRKTRLQTQKTLREVTQQFQDLYDNAPCGYHSINAEGYFENINRTCVQWLGYDHKEELIGKLKFTDVVTEESSVRFRDQFSKLVKEGSIQDAQFDIIRKDGNTFPVVMNATAIYDEHGNFKTGRSTMLDNTERKRASEKIRQLNTELEAFTYSVSHDLRAPLRSIDGYTRILLEDHGDKLDGEGRRVLNVIVTNAHRMGNLIDDLLDFSRIGRKEIVKSPVKMEGLVRSVMTELLEGEKGRNITYSLHALHACTADVSLMRQVWGNLISNALKYTRKKEKAHIEITSKSFPEEIVYSIRDNGTGFDMQYVGKLFGVFQRLHRQQDFEGTGVGLAVVHRIVTRHGGKVWAEAEPGRGATFYFSLPHEKQTYGQ